MKINKISISGFRGATKPVELLFDIKKPVVLIFGENGTGKSTIADAFDFLCKQSYGSLEHYSLGDSRKKYVATIGSAPSNVKISLTSDTETWIATLQQSGPSVTSGGYPDARILRRKAILKLIEAKPRDRFDELKDFIAVPNIDKSESALREAITTSEENFEESTRALVQVSEALESLWQKENKPGTNAIEWAEGEANKDITQIQKELCQVESITAGIQFGEDNLTLLDNSYEEHKKLKIELEEAEKKLKNAEAQQTQQSADLVELLGDAKIYIEKRKDLSKCPVCEKENKADDLLRQLSKRINEMQELKCFADIVSASKSAVINKEAILNQSQKNFCQKIRDLGGFLKACGLSEITTLNIQWESFKELTANVSPSALVENQGRQLLGSVLSSKIHLKNRKETDQKSVSHHNAIKGYVDDLKTKKAEASSEEALLAKLQAIYKIVSKERKNYIEGILADISTEVERLYTRLHPVENIGGIRFYLKPNAISSLEFDARFQNATEVPPQAYYSESHLDTLGICVFLALAKYFKTDSTMRQSHS